MKRFTVKQVLLLAAAALIVGVAATVLYFYLSTSAGGGDEPPIRVRNGSYHFELVGSGNWKDGADENGQPTWAVADGTGTGALTVKVLSANSTTNQPECKQGYVFNDVTKVMVRSSEQGEPLILFPGKEQGASGLEPRTKVAPRSNRMQVVNGGRTLSHGVSADYIDTITIHEKGGGGGGPKQTKCEFPSGADDLLCITSNAVASNCTTTTTKR